jgi:hypothetical protein
MFSMCVSFFEARRCRSRTKGVARGGGVQGSLLTGTVIGRPRGYRAPDIGLSTMRTSADMNNARRLAGFTKWKASRTGGRTFDRRRHSGGTDLMTV